MLYTNQLAFDVVLAHLRNQGCRSVNSNGSCAYRGSKAGRMCAVGVLIPNDKYHTAMEKSPLSEVLLESGLDYLDHSLCCSMQRAHDTNWGYKWQSYLEQEFSDIAEQYNLNYTQPS